MSSIVSQHFLDKTLPSKIPKKELPMDSPSKTQTLDIVKQDLPPSITEVSHSEACIRQQANEHEQGPGCQFHDSFLVRVVSEHGYALNGDHDQTFIALLRNPEQAVEGEPNCGGRENPQLITPAFFPPRLYSPPFSSIRSLSTISTLTLSDGLLDSMNEDGEDDFTILPEQDLNTYLLRDHSTYAHHVRAVGCSNLRRKLPHNILRLKRKRHEDSVKKLTNRLHTYRSMPA